VKKLLMQPPKAPPFNRFRQGRLDTGHVAALRGRPRRRGPSIARAIVALPLPRIIAATVCNGEQRFIEALSPQR
jgi:hypothetical protein